MAAEKCIGEGTGLTIIGECSASLEGLRPRIAHRFARTELKERRAAIYGSGHLLRIAFNGIGG